MIGSNRTFMELKSFSAHVDLRSMCSNRTFMELKYLMSLTPKKWKYGSNRTFMELKSNDRNFLIYAKNCSNRTFMELK